MTNVYSTQFSNYPIVPYAIASLVSYLKTDEKIKTECVFKKTYVHKKLYSEYVNECKDADILLCSCYVWNWSITTKFVEKIKQNNPSCLVILGGPQVPENDETFWDKYGSYVDIIVHGEGEYVLMDIFKQYFGDKKYKNIPGTEGSYYKGPPQQRINDLSTLPSPYLSGTVMELIDNHTGDEWIGIFETTRGCPFKCTFCDWGSATYTKMRRFDEKGLVKEIDWMADNKIFSFFVVDSNWGIFTERDKRIAEHIDSKTMELRKKRKSTGMKAIVVGWAKIKLTKLIPVVKAMRNSLGQGLEVALQSLDDTVLNNIERKNANIKIENIGELTEELLSIGVTGFIELIIGLPGETVDTFKSSLSKILQERRVGGVNGIYEVRSYLCQVLPNAKMNDPEYKRQYQIKLRNLAGRSTVKSMSNEELVEKEMGIISTYSYDENDLKEMISYFWLIRLFHLGGPTYELSWFLKDTFNIEIMDFYTVMLNFLKSNNTFFGKEYKMFYEFVDRGIKGEPWWDSAYIVGVDNEYEIEWTDYTFFDFTEIVKIGAKGRLTDDKNQTAIKLSKILFIKHIESKFNITLSNEIRDSFLTAQFEGCDFGEAVSTPVEDFDPNMLAVSTKHEPSFKATYQPELTNQVENSMATRPSQGWYPDEYHGGV